MEYHSTPTPKLSGWPQQPPRQPAKFLRCLLAERPWLRQFNEERSRVFRAGHDTSLPESEVPSPGRWIRSGRHAGCGIDRALRRLSRRASRSYRDRHRMAGEQVQPSGAIERPTTMGSNFLFPPGSPVYWDRTNEYQRHPDFGFHVWQEVGNPPRSVSVPINKRPMAGLKIPVKPEGRPR